MAARNSSSSYKLQTLATLLCRYTVVAGGSRWGGQTHHRELPPYKLDQGLRFFSVYSRAYNQPKLEMEKDQNGNVQVPPALPAPPKFGFSNWVKWLLGRVKWLLGSIVSFLLPLWKNKWDYLLTFEEKAEKVAEEAEVVAEVVEKVATTADKALEEVAKQLPDNSKLKDAAQVMEHISSVAAHDAQLIENIINKVDNVKQDLEDLEKMVEPIVDKIIQGKNPKV